MTRLLHMSDLHFGAVNDRLTEPLLALARQLQPDAAVVSGDLTQRARPAQFRRAAAFLARFGLPVLAVPGNHDVPLFNLGLRLFDPFGRYRCAFGEVLEPCLTLPRAIIGGINTANPSVWKAGRLQPASARHLAQWFRAAAPGQARVAVMHHAPVAAADGTPADIRDPAGVLRDLVTASTDIVLSGHTHMPHSGAAETAAGILFLQVGTAISTRLRTAWNDVSLVEIDGDRVSAQSWLADTDCIFRDQPAQHFRRVDGRWQCLDTAQAPVGTLAAQ